MPRLSAAALLGVLLMGSTTASAQPRQVQIYTFVIDHGLTLASRTDANGETISVASGKLRSVSGNRKNFDNQGTGHVTFWNRTVPDPFFAPLGSRAALIVFNFDPTMNPSRGYLGQIETPAGPRTTIGVLQQNANGKIIGPFPFIRGSWVILLPSTISGANPDDLVIQATVVLNQNPLNLGSSALNLIAHAANPPFASDATPGGMHLLDAATAIGSFYGETNIGGQTAPVRAFSSSLFPAMWAHLLAMPAGANDFTVVACWDLVATTTPKNCAVSGVGPALGNTAGFATYAPVATSTRLTLNRTLVP